MLDRETGETFTRGHRRRQPGRALHPGHHAHGFEALTDLLFCYHVTEEYDPDDPDEHGVPWDDPRVRHLWSTTTPILSGRATARLVLITGRRRAARPRARRRRSRTTTCSPSGGAGWDVRSDAPAAVRGAPDLVLHAAAWTDVDGAEDDPQGAAAVNVGGTAHAAALGAPIVAFSTDYVFDGRKRAPYVESDGPSPLSAYGRTKLHGEAAAGERAWIVRTSWLFGETGHNFVRTMLRLGVGARRGRGGRRPARLPDLRRPPRRGDASARRRRRRVRHLAPRRRRRLHVGGLRRGDLRGGRYRLPGAPDHDRRARRRRRARPTRSCAASAKALRGCRTGATACARASRGWMADRVANGRRRAEPVGRRSRRALVECARRVARSRRRRTAR